MFNKIVEWENYVTAKMIVMRLIIWIKLDIMRNYFVAIKLNYFKIYRIHEGIFYYKKRDRVIRLTFVANERNYIYSIKILTSWAFRN